MCGYEKNMIQVSIDRTSGAHSMLLIMFGAHMITGATLSGGMMGSGTMAVINGLWIPSPFVFGSGGLLIWVCFGQRE